MASLKKDGQKRWTEMEKKREYVKAAEDWSKEKYKGMIHKKLKVKETKNKSYLDEASQSEEDMMQTDVETQGTEGERKRESGSG